SADTVRAWMDRGPYSAIEARALGLVDTLLDRSDVDTLATHRARGTSLLKLSRYSERRLSHHALTRIALVTATGTITSGRSRITGGGERVLGSETLIEA